MRQSPIKVAIIIGSTRTGRFAPTVATWFANQVRQRDDIELDVVDLATTQLPETLGSFGQVPTEQVAAMAARLRAADAFIVVTPEYNHSYPAALKTAIDWHYDEWQAKPVAFVSYGGQAGGLRAVEHLRQVFAELHAVTIRDTVSFHNVHEQFAPDGAPVDPDSCGAAAQTLVDRLIWWASALREARAKQPYKV